MGNVLEGALETHRRVDIDLMLFIHGYDHDSTLCDGHRLHISSGWLAFSSATMEALRFKELTVDVTSRNARDCNAARTDHFRNE